jgi:hypothetical protein
MNWPTRPLPFTQAQIARMTAAHDAADLLSRACDETPYWWAKRKLVKARMEVLDACSMEIHGKPVPPGLRG